MTAYTITQTTEIRRRKDGAVAFFKGEIQIGTESIGLRVQTKAGDVAQYEIEGDTLTPIGDEAEAVVTAAVAHVQGVAAERAQRLTTIPEKVEAAVAAYSAHFHKAPPEGFRDAARAELEKMAFTALKWSSLDSVTVASAAIARMGRK